ncbi:MAG: ABC transporter ATP-binding protein, partial [Clostridia bacterium]
KYFVKYLPVAIIGLLLGMLALTCSLMLPKILGMIVDYGLSDGSGAIVGSFNPFYFLVEGKEYNTIELMALMCGAFVIVLLLKHISIYTRNNLNQYNGMRFNRVLRTLGVKKYWTYGRSAPMGIMFTMLNNNTVNIKEMYANWFPQLFDNFFLVVVGCALVGNINIQLLIVSIAAVPIIAGVSIIYMKRLTKATTRARSCFVDLNYCVEENISNFPLVKQYGREDYETAVFSGYNRRNKDSNIKVNKVMTWYGYVFNIIRAVTYALMIVIGTILAINKKISVGNFLEFVTYIFIILDGITNFMTVCYNINSLSASGNLFVDFMKTKSLNTRAGTEQVVAKPDIQITNLTLVRDNYKLLNDISIDIPYGKKVGITGTSGSGKTLLLK